MEKIAATPIFFIVGRPRSGTNLLRTLFDAHPEVNIPIECQFVVNLYRKYKQVQLWDRDRLEGFYADLLQQWKFDRWPIDRLALHKQLLAQPPDTTYAALCKLVYGAYQSVYPKEACVLLGDKNPGYTIYPELLLEIFPQARFIHFTRDYRDNFLSLRRVDFELPSIAYVVYKWKYFYRRMRAFTQLHPEQVYTLRYEELVQKPERVLPDLCAFLRLPYREEMLQFHQVQVPGEGIYQQEIQRKYHRSLMHPISSAKVNQWKTQLSPFQQKLADYVAGDTAEVAGYERRYKKLPCHVKWAALPGQLMGRGLYALTRLVDCFPATVRMRILALGPYVLGRSVKFFTSLFSRK